MDWISNFHFIRPWWLLALLPIAWLLWRLRSVNDETSQWQQSVDPELLAHLLIGNDDNSRQVLWHALLALAWLLCVVTLAGPSWERKDTPTYRNVNEQVLVIDLSRSMDAKDIQPSRLVRVRQKVEDILSKSYETENAVVIFAASPFVVSPLTNDAETIRSMLPAIETGIMPAQGSRIGDGIRKAHDLLKSVKSKDGRILLFTDSAVDGDTFLAAEEVAAAGISLSVIGVGSAEGAPIPIPRGGFIKDLSGNIVVARLDESALGELAKVGGGKYRRITADESDINSLLKLPARENPDDDENTESSQQSIEAWLDRGPWLALLLFCLLYTSPSPRD